MAYNFGLRLISLIDSGNIEDLYQIVYDNLSPLLIKGVYPVADNSLFNDFIERFTDKYFNRYLNFDTYGMLYIKLKFVLENNKEKYKRIYEAHLKEIDPLITFTESETIKEDTTNTGEAHGEGETTISSRTSNNGMDTTTTTTSFEDRKDTTEVTPTGSEINSTKTDDQRNVIAHSSNPKSQSIVSENIGSMTYIDDETLNKTVNDYHTTTSFNNRKDKTEFIPTGKEINKTENELGTTYETSGVNGSSNSANTKDIKDSKITRIKNGFSGNQMELLAAYSALVFDINNEIIADIDRARLFMSTLA